MDYISLSKSKRKSHSACSLQNFVKGNSDLLIFSKITHQYRCFYLLKLHISDYHFLANIYS